MQNILHAVEQQYFTKTQARIYVALSERTLDYARARKELQFFKIGKRVLFKKSDLDAFIERHRARVDLDQIVDEVLAEVAR
jgi:excisionase family DNA binding protein